MTLTTYNMFDLMLLQTLRTLRKVGFYFLQLHRKQSSGSLCNTCNFLTPYQWRKTPSTCNFPTQSPIKRHKYVQKPGRAQYLSSKPESAACTTHLTSGTISRTCIRFVTTLLSVELKCTN